MGTGSFPGGKERPERAADHSPPSSAAVMEEYSHTSTHPLGHTGPVTGKLYLFTFYYEFKNSVIQIMLSWMCSKIDESWIGRNFEGRSIVESPRHYPTTCTPRLKQGFSKMSGMTVPSLNYAITTPHPHYLKIKWSCHITCHEDTQEEWRYSPTHS